LYYWVTKELREEKIEETASFVDFKIQIGQGQVSEYQEGGMPFGLDDGFALTLVYVLIEPQAILKLP